MGTSGNPRKRAEQQAAAVGKAVDRMLARQGDTQYVTPGDASGAKAGEMPGIAADTVGELVLEMGVTVVVGLMQGITMHIADCDEMSAVDAVEQAQRDVGSLEFTPENIRTVMAQAIGWARVNKRDTLIPSAHLRLSAGMPGEVIVQCPDCGANKPQNAWCNCPTQVAKQLAAQQEERQLFRTIRLSNKEAEDTAFSCADCGARLEFADGALVMEHECVPQEPLGGQAALESDGTDA
jgi:hypothetical protein